MTIRSLRWHGLPALLAVAALMLSVAEPAFARSGKQLRTPRRATHRVGRVFVNPIPARLPAPVTPPSGPYVSALLIDADTGNVLFARDPDQLRRPASLVKMMLALITFESIESGEVSLHQPFVVSLLASQTGGSGVALRAGEVLPLEELLKAVLVASANGASVAIAEALAGNCEHMIQRMNERARELGMLHTTYYTVNGLPPMRRKGALPDLTSASDLAILARKLLEHKAVLAYVSRPRIGFRNGTVMLKNTNHLVGQMDGADGLKTGYYRLAGFNLAATANRRDLRLIAIVLGCPTLNARFQVAQQLLEWGFANYSRAAGVNEAKPAPPTAVGDDSGLHTIADSTGDDRPAAGLSTSVSTISPLGVAAHHEAVGSLVRQ